MDSFRESLERLAELSEDEPFDRLKYYPEEAIEQILFGRWEVFDYSSALPDLFELFEGTQNRDVFFWASLLLSRLLPGSAGEAAGSYLDSKLRELRDWRLILLIQAILSLEVAWMTQKPELEYFPQAVMPERLRKAKEIFDEQMKEPEQLSPELERLSHLLRSSRPSGSISSRPSNDLAEAARHNDLKAAKYLLSQGADPEQPESIHSPLGLAASLGNLEMVELLMAAGVEPDLSGHQGTPITLAARSGHSEIVQRLLEFVPLSRAGQALQMAAMMGHFFCVKALVEAGVDPINHAQYEQSMVVERQDHSHLLGHSLEEVEGAGVSTDHLDKEELRASVEAMGSADTFDHSIQGAAPADLAEAAGHGRIARYLRGESNLEREHTEERCTPMSGAGDQIVGATVELLGSGALAGQLDNPIDKGLTPLMLAAENGLCRVVSELLKAGASPDSKPVPAEGTALMLAALHGFDEVVHLLLEAGADPAARAETGATALFRASERGDLVSVRLLLAAGADSLCQTRGGQTALSVAGGIFRSELRSLLREAMTKARAASGERPHGVVFHPQALRDGAIERGGVLDFLERCAEWALIAVRAPIEEVGSGYAKIRRSARRILAIGDKNVPAIGDWAYVVSLYGPWVLILRALGRADLETRHGTHENARELSSKLSKRASSFTGEDTSACLHFEIFDRGKLVEKAVWEDGGELVELVSRGQGLPHAFSTDRASVDRVFAEEGIFIPPCAVQNDGQLVRLNLFGLERSDVERVDFIALERSTGPQE